MRDHDSNEARGGSALCSTDQQSLAVIDLDGTLVEGDTLLPFLVSYGWRQRRLRPLIALPVYLGLYACRILSDRAAKERLIISFLRGEQLDEVGEHADWFTREWVLRRLKSDMLHRLHEHQRAGHRVILLSASPEIYVPRIAKELGITEVVCTKIASDDCFWNGAIVGANCRGTEKLARLRAYLGCDHWPVESYAYGDQDSDLSVLCWADNGYLVTRRSGIVEVERSIDKAPRR